VNRSRSGISDAESGKALAVAMSGETALSDDGPVEAGDWGWSRG
jgi:hypothetical protein